MNLASIALISHFDVTNVFIALSALEEHVKELKRKADLYDNINGGIRSWLQNYPPEEE